MCFRIFAFIRNAIKACIYIAIDVIVFFACSLSDFIDSIEWPVIKAFYGIFKLILKKQFEKKITYSTVPHLSGEYGIQDFQRGNAYVEDLLRDINGKLVERSFILEDKVSGFQNTRIIPMKGELGLYSNVHMDYRIMRSGNCSLRKEGKRSRINASIKGCELYLECDIQMTIENFTKTFHVTGNIPYIEAYIEFSFNNETSEDGQLADFIVIEMFGMNLKFVGAGPLNFILDFTSKKLLKVFKRRVMAILQGKIRSQLTVLIETFKFPVARISRTPEHSPRPEWMQPIAEESDHSSSTEPQQASPESADRSPPTEPQRASPEAADPSRPTEQQRASPEAADHSRPTEQQGEGPDGENSSFPQQQIERTIIKGPHNSTYEIVTPIRQIPIPLIKMEDSSQSSDGNDTVETDCSIEA